MQGRNRSGIDEEPQGLNSPIATLSHILPLPQSTAAQQKTSYDIDERDYFRNSFGSYTFPRVAEEVETQLKAYRAAVEEINKKTTAGPQVGLGAHRRWRGGGCTGSKVGGRCGAARGAQGLLQRATLTADAVQRAHSHLPEVASVFVPRFYSKPTFGANCAGGRCA